MWIFGISEICQIWKKISKIRIGTYRYKEEVLGKNHNRTSSSTAPASSIPSTKDDVVKEVAAF
jgi:hypothetical protein